MQSAAGMPELHPHAPQIAGSSGPLARASAQHPSTAISDSASVSEHKLSRSCTGAEPLQAVLPHKRASDADSKTCAYDVPMLYSEGLAPERTAYDDSTIQQSSYAMQRLQQSQLMHGHSLQIPLRQELLFGSTLDALAGGNVLVQDPRSILQQRIMFQAMQDQQQLVFQQHQLMQEQQSRQLMLLLQQQVQAQLPTMPLIHPSYDWSFGLSNESVMPPFRAQPVAGSDPAYRRPAISQAIASPGSSAIADSSLVSALSGKLSGAHSAAPRHRVAICAPQPVSSKSSAAALIPAQSAAAPKAQPKAKKAKSAKVSDSPLLTVPSIIAIAPRPQGSHVPLIGSGGKSPGQFDHPIGIAIDAGHIIVCDHDNHRVQVLRCWDGLHLSTFGSSKPSKNEGKFHRPQGVVVDRSHHIIVTDQGNHRVQAINYATGRLVFSVGTFGEGPSQFANPCGLALHPSGQIVICDSGNHRLQILEADGKFVRCIGTQGRESGQFKSPLSVGCSLDGQRLVVAEYGNLRVQVLRWSDGAHLYTINKYYRPKISWCPSGIAIDTDGHALIVNSDSNSVELFRIDNGDYVRSIELAAPSIVGPVTPETQLSRPRGIALSEDLDIAVTDHGLNHVQVILKQQWYIDTK